MTEDILPGATNSLKQDVPVPPTKKKNRVSIIAVIFAIFLAIVMIMFGERVIFDLNRTINPAVVETDTVQTASAVFAPSVVFASSYSTESTFLSSSKVKYLKEQSSEYKMYKLLIHSAFIIPAFLLVFVLYFWIWHKKEDDVYKVVVFGYLIFAFWMMLHLLFELSSFILQEYKNIGVYIVLLILAAIFTILSILIQKKVNHCKKQ